jgi:hypothetical protein
MRRAGRIDPGSGGAVFTGQSVFLRPALTAITRAMLSFLVRPLMVGTVIGGSLSAAESFALCDVVLDALDKPEPGVAPPALAEPAAEFVTPGLEAFATPAAWVVEDAATTPCVVIWFS